MARPTKRSGKAQARGRDGRFVKRTPQATVDNNSASNTQNSTQQVQGDGAEDAFQMGHGQVAYHAQTRMLICSLVLQGHGKMLSPEANAFAQANGPASGNGAIQESWRKMYVFKAGFGPSLIISSPTKKLFDPNPRDRKVYPGPSSQSLDDMKVPELLRFVSESLKY